MQDEHITLRGHQGNIGWTITLRGYQVMQDELITLRGYQGNIG